MNFRRCVERVERSHRFSERRESPALVAAGLWTRTGYAMASFDLDENLILEAFLTGHETAR